MPPSDAPAESPKCHPPEPGISHAAGSRPADRRRPSARAAWASGRDHATPRLSPRAPRVGTGRPALGAGGPPGWRPACPAAEERAGEYPSPLWPRDSGAAVLARAYPAMPYVFVSERQGPWPLPRSGRSSPAQARPRTWASRCIRICSGMPRASNSPMRATTRGSFSTT